MSFDDTRIDDLTTGSNKPDGTLDKTNRSLDILGDELDLLLADFTAPAAAPQQHSKTQASTQDIKRAGLVGGLKSYRYRAPPTATYAKPKVQFTPTPHTKPQPTSQATSQPPASTVTATPIPTAKVSVAPQITSPIVAAKMAATAPTTQAPATQAPPPAAKVAITSPIVAAKMSATAPTQAPAAKVAITSPIVAAKMSATAPTTQAPAAKVAITSPIVAAKMAATAPTTQAPAAKVAITSPIVAAKMAATTPTTTAPAGKVAITSPIVAAKMSATAPTTQAPAAKVAITSPIVAAKMSATAPTQAPAVQAPPPAAKVAITSPIVAAKMAATAQTKSQIPTQMPQAQIPVNVQADVQVPTNVMKEQPKPATQPVQVAVTAEEHKPVTLPMQAGAAAEPPKPVVAVEPPKPQPVFVAQPIQPAVVAQPIQPTVVVEPPKPAVVVEPPKPQQDIAVEPPKPQPVFVAQPIQPTVVAQPIQPTVVTQPIQPTVVVEPPKQPVTTEEQKPQQDIVIEPPKPQPTIEVEPPKQPVTTEEQKPQQDIPPPVPPPSETTAKGRDTPTTTTRHKPSYSLSSLPTISKVNANATVSTTSATTNDNDNNSIDPIVTTTSTPSTGEATSSSSSSINTVQSNEEKRKMRFSWRRTISGALFKHRTKKPQKEAPELPKDMAGSGVRTIHVRNTMSLVPTDAPPTAPAPLPDLAQMQRARDSKTDRAHRRPRAPDAGAHVSVPRHKALWTWLRDYGVDKETCAALMSHGVNIKTLIDVTDGDMRSYGILSFFKRFRMSYNMWLSAKWLVVASLDDNVVDEQVPAHTAAAAAATTTSATSPTSSPTIAASAASTNVDSDGKDEATGNRKEEGDAAQSVADGGDELREACEWTQGLLGSKILENLYREPKSERRNAVEELIRNVDIFANQIRKFQSEVISKAHKKVKPEFDGIEGLEDFLALADVWDEMSDALRESRPCWAKPTCVGECLISGVSVDWWSGMFLKFFSTRGEARNILDPLHTSKRMQEHLQQCEEALGGKSAPEYLYDTVRIQLASFHRMLCDIRSGTHCDHPDFPILNHVISRAKALIFSEEEQGKSDKRLLEHYKYLDKMALRLISAPRDVVAWGRSFVKEGQDLVRIHPDVPASKKGHLSNYSYVLLSDYLLLGKKDGKRFKVKHSFDLKEAKVFDGEKSKASFGVTEPFVWALQIGTAVFFSADSLEEKNEMIRLFQTTINNAHKERERTRLLKSQIETSLNL